MMRGRLIRRIELLEDTLKPAPQKMPEEALSILKELGVKAPGDRPQGKARQGKNLRKYTI
jgi:hypothetical protein